MESTAVTQAPDFSKLMNGQQTCSHVYAKSGRVLYPSDLTAAAKAGHIQQVLVAGRKLYYLPDIEEFAKKWGERVIKLAA